MPVQPFVGVHQITFTFPGPLEVQAGNFVWPCIFNNLEIVKVVAAAGRTTRAAADPVIFDVNIWDPNTDIWETVFTTQSNRPRVEVGELIGESAFPDITSISLGMALRVDIDSVGGGATPTDEDFVVVVHLRGD